MTRRVTKVRLGLYGLLFAGALLGVDQACAQSAEAEKGVIIISRPVPHRLAYREGPPAPPRQVRTAPDIEFSDVIVGGGGIERIDDSKAGQITAAVTAQMVRGPLSPSGPFGAWGVGARGERSFGDHLRAAGGGGAGAAVRQATEDLSGTILRALGVR